MTITIVENIETPTKSDLIRTLWPVSCKLDKVSRYISRLRDGANYSRGYALVTHVVKMDVHEYHDLSHNLLSDRDFLDRLGGTGSWDPELQGYTDIAILNDPELRARWIRTSYRNVVRVECKDRHTLLIDPQGYAYARYVGFLASLEQDQTAAA